MSPASDDDYYARFEPDSGRPGERPPTAGIVTRARLIRGGVSLAVFAVALAAGCATGLFAPASAVPEGSRFLCSTSDGPVVVDAVSGSESEPDAGLLDVLRTAGVTCRLPLAFSPSGDAVVVMEYLRAPDGTSDNGPWMQVASRTRAAGDDRSADSWTIRPTSAGPVDRPPAWAQDGRAFLWLRFPVGTHAPAVVVADAAGATRAELPIPQKCVLPSFCLSPDGAVAAFGAWHGDILLSPADGSRPWTSVPRDGPPLRRIVGWSRESGLVFSCDAPGDAEQQEIRAIRDAGGALVDAREAGRGTASAGAGGAPGASSARETVVARIRGDVQVLACNPAATVFLCTRKREEFWHAAFVIHTTGREVTLDRFAGREFVGGTWESAPAR